MKEVENFYNQQIINKVNGYINGNIRLDMAFKMLQRFWPESVENVLEIGSGAGDNISRMQSVWKKPNYIGLDISPKSVEISNKLFSNNKVRFIQGTLNVELFDRKFDVIVLFDVYEHISNNDKPDFNSHLNKLLTDRGIIFLTFPTPRHLAYLKSHNPSALQPVDEDIDINILRNFALDTNTELYYYSDINIWKKGDYAHAIFRRKVEDWNLYPEKRTLIKKLSDKIKHIPFNAFIKPLRKFIIKKKLKI